MYKGKSVGTRPHGQILYGCFLTETLQFQASGIRSGYLQLLIIRSKGRSYITSCTIYFKSSHIVPVPLKKSTELKLKPQSKIYIFLSYVLVMPESTGCKCHLLTSLFLKITLLQRVGFKLMFTCIQLIITVREKGEPHLSVNCSYLVPSVAHTTSTSPVLVSSSISSMTPLATAITLLESSI